MLKQLDEFIEHLKTVQLYDNHRWYIAMHPLTFQRVLSDLGLKHWVTFSFYKGYRIELDPSITQNHITTQYY